MMTAQQSFTKCGAHIVLFLPKNTTSCKKNQKIACFFEDIIYNKYDSIHG